MSNNVDSLICSNLYSSVLLFEKDFKRRSFLYVVAVFFVVVVCLFVFFVLFFLVFVFFVGFVLFLFIYLFIYLFFFLGGGVGVVI